MHPPSTIMACRCQIEHRYRLSRAGTPADVASVSWAHPDVESSSSKYWRPTVHLRLHAARSCLALSGQPGAGTTRSAARGCCARMTRGAWTARGPPWAGTRASCGRRRASPGACPSRARSWCSPPPSRRATSSVRPAHKPPPSGSVHQAWEWLRRILGLAPVRPHTPGRLGAAPGSCLAPSVTQPLAEPAHPVCDPASGRAQVTRGFGWHQRCCVSAEAQAGSAGPASRPVLRSAGTPGLL